VQVDELKEEPAQYVLIDGHPPWHVQGHTSLVIEGPPMPHPTLLHPCASAPVFFPACTSAPYSVLPLIYAQRTAALAPLRMLLTKYLSTISPRAVYLGAPTNGHAHVGHHSASSISWGHR
jgi:hypothetical protein